MSTNIRSLGATAKTRNLCKMSSTSTSPCAACKFLRRKCTYECVFAPYFPPDQPQKFANVHKVFGASNVAKLLNDLTPNYREDAVNSLAYEAEYRLRDPVYGCVGLVSILQQKLRLLQVDLFNGKKELSNYVGPSAMLPLVHQHHAIMTATPTPVHFGVQTGGLGFQVGASSSQAHLHHQIIEAQQIAAAREQQQELMRSLQQLQLQQQEMTRFNHTGRGVGSGFDPMNSNMPHPMLMPLQTQQNQPQMPLQTQQNQPQLEVKRVEALQDPLLNSHSET